MKQTQDKLRRQGKQTEQNIATNLCRPLQGYVYSLSPIPAILLMITPTFKDYIRSCKIEKYNK